jgi:hypothetical protein
MRRTRRIRKLGDGFPNSPDVRDLHFSCFGVSPDVHPMRPFEFVLDYGNSRPIRLCSIVSTANSLCNLWGYRRKILNLRWAAIELTRRLSVNFDFFMKNPYSPAQAAKLEFSSTIQSRKREVGQDLEYSSDPLAEYSLAIPDFCTSMCSMQRIHVGGFPAAGVHDGADVDAGSGHVLGRAAQQPMSFAPPRSSGRARPGRNVEN